MLPLAGAARHALVWFPLSRIVAGSAGDARIERLAIRGAIADRLDSVEATLDGLRRACAADDCELFMVDSSGREVVLVDCEGADREAFLEKTHMPLGTGYPGTVTLTQTPLFTNRFQEDRRFVREEVKRRGIKSFLGVPLLHAGRPLGYIGLGWRNSLVPMQWGLKVLEDLKTLVPVALRDRYLPARRAENHADSLEIRCFGPFEIFCGGRKIPAAAFGRRKALELLKYLILQQGVPAHRDQLVDILWPGVAPRSGANRLHGVVNALRGAIEAGRSGRAAQYVICQDDRYFFNTGMPHVVDFYDFLEIVAEARSAQRQGAVDHALGLFESAIRIYRGELFAEDAGSEAFEIHRTRIRHGYLDAVRAVARTRIERNHIEEGIGVLRTALALEPVAVDLQEMLIAQLIRAGRIVEARQQYESCRIAFRRYLDMDPPARARALEKQLY